MGKFRAVHNLHDAKFDRDPIRSILPFTKAGQVDQEQTCRVQSLSSFKGDNEVQLNWIKCGGDLWCDFQKVNLDHLHFHDLKGVYVIWHGGPGPKVVYVGQGTIAERLKAHRKDIRILLHSGLGLYVTWAKVDDKSRDGVELFVAGVLRPLVGAKFPQAQVIRVNLPW